MTGEILSFSRAYHWKVGSGDGGRLGGVQPLTEQSLHDSTDVGYPPMRIKVSPKRAILNDMMGHSVDLDFFDQPARGNKIGNFSNALG